MDTPPDAEIGALIEQLQAGGVEFIVVGGAAVLLHGASIVTRDLDVVPSLDPPNLARLLAVLQDLKAHYRQPGNRILEPTLAHLTAGGQAQLRTRLGPLDVLGRLHDGEGYEELLPHTIEMGSGVPIRVVDLPKLITIKSTTGRAKDRFAASLLVEILRATQDVELPPGEG